MNTEMLRFINDIFFKKYAMNLAVESFAIKNTLKQPHRVKGKVNRSRRTERVMNKNVTHPLVS